jgi:hypothetical protein
VVTANAKPVLGVINRVSDTLSVNPIFGGNYVWSLNGTVIPGANATSLVMTQIGRYTVRAVNPSGCADTAGISILVGLANVNPQTSVSVYPNPAHDVLNITLEGVHPYRITNNLGQTVAEGLLNNNQLQIEALAQGVYYLNIEGVKRLRFIKE